MWIITPDVAFNTEICKAIWTDGMEPCLYLQSAKDSDCDRIMFDSAVSAVRAFDAVMNGIVKGCRTLLIREKAMRDGSTSLVTEYDAPYTTVLNEEGEPLIADPRIWDNHEQAQTFVLKPSAIKS